jgi:DNA-binding MarR family transcriptional regulator
MTQPADTIESLARALYAVSAMRRDLQRLAGLEHAITGLTALGAVKRLGPVRVSDVATELQVNLSVASRQVQALEDEGLIVRVPDPSDGRSSLVELSARGCERLEAVHVRMTDALQSALAEWDPGDLRSLADGLVRLRADLAAPLAPGEVPATPDARSGQIEENLR